MSFLRASTRRIDEIIGTLESMERAGITLAQLKTLAARRRRGLAAGRAIAQDCPECHKPMIFMGEIEPDGGRAELAWLCPGCRYERIGTPVVRRVCHIVQPQKKGVSSHGRSRS